MALGILEPQTEGSHVPGTAFMGAGAADNASTASGHDPRLKYDRTGRKSIVLVPQPSDDPNDPLNWPLWKRDCITTILCLVSIMAATLGPLLAANTVTLALFWKKQFTQVALLTGWHLCGVGVAGVICVPSSRVWGKRHLFVLGTILLIVSTAWGGAASTYTSLLWSRIVQGAAVAPFESLVNAAVGDLYCVHQRGKRMAFTNFALYGGAFFTPVIAGKMTDTLGWRWPFYLVAIFSGVLLPLVFFFVPETAFRRPNRFNTDTVSKESVLYSSEGWPATCGNPDSLEVEKGNVADGGRAFSENDPARPFTAGRQKITFIQSLVLFNGRKADDSLLKLFIRPFPLLLHPAILWAMLTQGVLIGWTVMIGVVLGVIFMGPPLLFDEVKTGYEYTGAFIGAMLGFLIAGPAADWSAKYLTRKNGGIYEPEFRIVLVIPQAVLGILGVYGFGFSSANVRKYHAILPSFFFGLEVMGMVIGAVASALYIVDAHRNIAIEAFTCLLLFKNFFSFALTWKAYDWLAQDGAWKLFWVVGTVQVAVCMLSIPMYVLGKKNRWFMHQHDILRATRLD